MNDFDVDEFGILVNSVKQWHYDRNLINGSTDKDQVLKLLQELGELSDSVCKGKNVADDLGDMLVIMINIAERNGLELNDCLDWAWRGRRNGLGCWARLSNKGRGVAGRLSAGGFEDDGPEETR